MPIQMNKVLNGLPKYFLTLQVKLKKVREFNLRIEGAKKGGHTLKRKILLRPCSFYKHRRYIPFSSTM